MVLALVCCRRLLTSLCAIGCSEQADGVAHLESPFLELRAVEELKVAAGIGGRNDVGFGSVDMFQFAG